MFGGVAGGREQPIEERGRAAERHIAASARGSWNIEHSSDTTTLPTSPLPTVHSYNGIPQATP